MEDFFNGILTWSWMCMTYLFRPLTNLYDAVKTFVETNLWVAKDDVFFNSVWLLIHEITQFSTLSAATVIFLIYLCYAYFKYQRRLIEAFEVSYFGNVTVDIIATIGYFVCVGIFTNALVGLGTHITLLARDYAAVVKSGDTIVYASFAGAVLSFLAINLNAVVSNLSHGNGPVALFNSVLAKSAVILIGPAAVLFVCIIAFLIALVPASLKINRDADLASGKITRAQHRIREDYGL